MLDKRSRRAPRQSVGRRQGGGDERAGAAASIAPICSAPTSASPIMAAATLRPRSRQKDPLTGETVEVLWVKGSGGDSASIKLDGFATLYMDKLEALKGLYRGVEHEDEMVGYLPHCTFNLNPRAASIDTPLHAYRAAASMSTTCIPTRSSRSPRRKTARTLTREIFGDEIGWLPWKRPGFELGLWLEKFCAREPESQGRGAGEPRAVHLGRHAEGMLRDDAAHHQPGHRMVRRRGARQAGVRRRRCEGAASRRSGARSRRG